MICSLYPIRKKIDEELDSTRQKIFLEIHKCDDTGLFFRLLPENGMNNAEIIDIAGKFLSKFFAVS